VLASPKAQARQFAAAWERPTGSTLLERLRSEAERESVEPSRFSSSRAHRNAAWRAYRNFLRQAISNFGAAMTVETRSAVLLYYYAMLNFAKAELLALGVAGIDGPIAHGLPLDVTQAGTVQGDSLTVVDGVFPALYQALTGWVLPVGTRRTGGSLRLQRRLD
jgi:hypothetical protein